MAHNPERWQRFSAFINPKLTRRFWPCCGDLRITYRPAYSCGKNAKLLDYS